MPTETIYVPLINEGTEVWRPVEAEPVSDALFRVESKASDDEQWGYASGQIVAVEERMWSNGDHGLVATRIGPYARIDVSGEDLQIINNVLNEICNGIDLKGDSEARIGAVVRTPALYLCASPRCSLRCTQATCSSERTRSFLEALVPGS